MDPNKPCIEDNPPLIEHVVAIVNGPSVVGQCNNVTLDASGSQSDIGKVVMFEWLVLGDAVQNREFIVERLEASRGKPTVTLTPAVLGPALGAKNITFSIVITTELNNTAVAFHTVQILNVDMPSISIYGPANFSTSIASELVLRSAVEVITHIHFCNST